MISLRINYPLSYTILEKLLQLVWIYFVTFQFQLKNHIREFDARCLICEMGMFQWCNTEYGRWPTGQYLWFLAAATGIGKALCNAFRIRIFSTYTPFFDTKFMQIQKL